MGKVAAKNRYVLPGAELTAANIVWAGLSKESERAVENAVADFVQKFHKVLPASPPTVKDYIVWSAQQGRAPTTISTRVALIGSWHSKSGYVDPTKDPEIKALLKGLRKANTVPAKKARPLLIRELRTMVDYCDQQHAYAQTLEDPRQARATQLRAIRDKAMILTGFWFGYRGDDLVRLSWNRVGFTQGDVDETGRLQTILTLGMPYSKGDRLGQGDERAIPELDDLCPVKAMQDWCVALDDPSGPVFVGISRWGDISTKAMYATRTNSWLKELMGKAGLDAKGYSSHSMRRGLATFADSMGISAAELAHWVRWKNIETANSYVERANALPYHLMKLQKNKGDSENQTA